jgi:hypothetical protein
MPKNGDFKMIVRDRMAKTGESYSIARMMVVGSGGDTPTNGAGKPMSFVPPVDPPAEMPVADNSICQIKISLAEIEPEIWRRIHVPAVTTLGQLHEILQAAFGWWNYHLHQYIVDGQHYGLPNPEYSEELPPMIDERTVTLRDILGAGKIAYEYDFGDGWQHLIEIESVAVKAEPGIKYPICVGGERAGPHEDSGGVGGYADLIEALANKDHPEHKAMRRWAGRKYDPEKFDLAAVNKMLGRPQGKRPRDRRDGALSA